MSIDAGGTVGLDMVREIRWWESDELGRELGRDEGGVEEEDGKAMVEVEASGEELDDELNVPSSGTDSMERSEATLVRLALRLAGGWSDGNELRRGATDRERRVISLESGVNHPRS